MSQNTRMDVHHIFLHSICASAVSVQLACDFLRQQFSSLQLPPRHVLCVEEEERKKSESSGKNANDGAAKMENYFYPLN